MVGLFTGITGSPIHEANIQAEAYSRLRMKGVNVELERRIDTKDSYIRPDMVILDSNRNVIMIVEFKQASYNINGFVTSADIADPQIKSYLTTGYKVYVCSGMRGLEQLICLF